jgi:hypothetical protein
MIFAKSSSHDVSMMCWRLMRPGEISPDIVDLNTGRIEIVPADRFIHADLDHRWAQPSAHHDLIEHDEHVMDMNEVRCCASEPVQRAGRNVVS